MTHDIHSRVIAAVPSRAQDVPAGFPERYVLSHCRLVPLPLDIPELLQHCDELRKAGYSTVVVTQSGIESALHVWVPRAEHSAICDRNDEEITREVLDSYRPAEDVQACAKDEP